MGDDDDDDDFDNIDEDNINISKEEFGDDDDLDLEDNSILQYGTKGEEEHELKGEEDSNLIDVEMIEQNKIINESELMLEQNKNGDPSDQNIMIDENKVNN